jgi:hypothetical protein
MLTATGWRQATRNLPKGGLRKRPRSPRPRGKERHLARCRHHGQALPTGGAPRRSRFMSGMNLQLPALPDPELPGPLSAQEYPIKWPALAMPTWNNSGWKVRTPTWCRYVSRFPFPVFFSFLFFSFLFLSFLFFYLGALPSHLLPPFSSTIYLWQVWH